jgi:hypothetical protein
MSARVRFLVGTSIGAAGAVLWAVCLVVLEPPSEPKRVAGLALAGNNTYWVRDLRWAAVFAITAMVVTLAGGELVRSAAAVLGTVGWLAADILLDRANVHGTATAVLVAVAGAALSTGACWAVRRGRRRHDRPVLLVVALAAALSVTAALSSSPSDSEPALDPISWAVAAVLALAAVVAAASVSSVPARGRRVFVGCLAGAALVVPALIRAVAPGHRVGPGLAWGWVLSTALALLAWGWAWSAQPRAEAESPAAGAAVGGRVRRITLLAVLDLVAFTFSSCCCAFGQFDAQFDKAITGWTGNSPVNAADTDLLMSGVAVGCGLGVAILWFVLRAATTTATDAPAQ